MIKIFSNFFFLLIAIIPITLITGPAIPDITITLAGLFFLFIIFYNNEYKKLLWNKLTIISFIFWIYLLVSSFFAENILLAFRDSVIFIRILLIPIFIVYWISSNSKSIEKIITLIFITVCLVALDTFFQFLHYDAEFGFGEDLIGFVPNWYGRLTGPFGDELIPGAYLSKFTFLGLIFFFIRKNKKLTLLPLIYLSFIGFIIFVTGERIAFATYLLGLTFLLFFHRNNRIFYFLTITIVILSVIIITNKHPFYNDFTIVSSSPTHLGLVVEKNFKCNDGSTTTCKKIINLQPEFLVVLKNFKKSAYGEIYNTSLEMFKDNKFFGVGLNNFNFLCNNNSRYKAFLKNYSCPTHPHNIYIQALAETGIFGLLMLVIYITYLFNHILRKNFNEYSLIGLATLLVLFWPVMSTGSLLKNWNGISIFFIIGICITLTNLDKKNN